MEISRKYNRISEVLAQQGRSQKWLAQQLGISNNAMNSLCTQKSQPTLQRLMEIAQILSVDPCELLDKSILQK